MLQASTIHAFGVSLPEAELFAWRSKRAYGAFMSTLRLVVSSLFGALGVLAIACGDDAAPNSSTESDAGTTTGPDASDPRSADATLPHAALDPELAARAAVFIGSCLRPGSNRYLQRMYDEIKPDERAVVDSIPCFATKTNGCEALAECLGYSVADDVSCAMRCDGDESVICDDSKEYREDCRFKGQTCVLAGKEPMCAPAGTILRPCEYSAFTESCEDGRPTYCRGARGKDFGPKCSDHGLTCATYSASATDMYLCKGAGGDCQVPSSGPGSAQYRGVACAGASLDACVNGGKTTIACSSVATGFTCQERGTMKFCGLAAECDPGTTENRSTCDGTSVVVCNAGKITRVDCTTLGFTGCDARYGVCSPGPWAL